LYKKRFIKKQFKKQGWAYIKNGAHVDHILVRHKSVQYT